MHRYTVESVECKIVADYARISIFDALELSIDEFYSTLRDAVIYNNMQTDEGNKRLDDAWIFEQTKPDRKSLRETFGKR